MQFVPTDDYIYFWPVKVVLPSTTEPGKTVTETFTIKFKLLPTDKAEALAEASRKALNADDATASKFVEAQKSQIRMVVVGWDQNTLLDASKRPVPFSVEALDTYLNFAPIRDAIVRAYGDSLTQRPPEGN